MAKITLQIDTDKVIGFGDIAWGTWCDDLNELLWSFHTNEGEASLPDGVEVLALDATDR